MYVTHLIFYCLFNAISSSDYIASNGMTNYTFVVKFQVLFRNSPCQTKSDKESSARLDNLQEKIFNYGSLKYTTRMLFA